jgi:hypothetical protein
MLKIFILFYKKHENNDALLVEKYLHYQSITTHLLDNLNH